MKLPAIATELKQEAMAAPHQPRRRALSKGLRLTLIFKVSEWRLSLTREGVYPSEREIEICKAVFDVPKSCAQIKQIVDVKGVNFHVVKLVWPVQAQFDFVDTGQAVATVNHYREEA